MAQGMKLLTFILISRFISQVINMKIIGNVMYILMSYFRNCKALWCVVGPYFSKNFRGLRPQNPAVPCLAARCATSHAKKSRGFFNVKVRGFCLLDGKNVEQKCIAKNAIV